MIIWKKLGFLGFIVPIGLAMILQLLLGDHTNYAGIGYLIGGILVWQYGKKWNDAIEEKNTFDPTVKRSSKHSMFWIQLEYWGIFFGIMGLTILVSENIVDLGTDPTFIIWALSLVGIISYQVYKNRNGNQQHVDILDSPEYSMTNKHKERKEKIETIKQSLDVVPPKKYETTDHSRYMPKPNKED